MPQYWVSHMFVPSVLWDTFWKKIGSLKFSFLAKSAFGIKHFFVPSFKKKIDACRRQEDWKENG